MQRVLNERNLFKQRFLELEEAVHRGNAMRASKQEQHHHSSTASDDSSNHSNHKQQTTFWKMFSGLFGSGDKSATMPSRRLTPKQSVTGEQNSARNSFQESPNKNQSASERCYKLKHFFLNQKNIIFSFKI